MRLILQGIQYRVTHTKICIIGGGTAGLSTSAGLLRQNINPRDIRVFDPAEFHYYQPGWTMVGSNLASAEITRQPMAETLPQPIHYTKSKIGQIDPSKNQLTTVQGQAFTYDHLVIASGFELRPDKVQGLQELLNDPLSNVATIYSYDSASKMGILSERFQGGNAIFTEPPLPIKCAGAPQKILYLWADKWSQKGLKTNINFMKAAAVMFGVPKYSATLTQTAQSYGINVKFKHSLIKVNAKTATFKNMDTNQKVQLPYDLLHVVPPMSPPEFIAKSGLADANGFVEVDKHTLQHQKYKNVWSLGDSSSAPCSKTAAAVFAQEEVLVKNIVQTLTNSESQLQGKYEGYASCPLFVGNKKLMLAEFKYDGVVDETFLRDQERPRGIFYYLKVYFFPFVYWNFVPRGLWGGRKGFKNPW